MAIGEGVPEETPKAEQKSIDERISEIESKIEKTRNDAEYNRLTETLNALKSEKEYPKEFNDWFRGSKVVGDRQAPLPVYRGGEVGRSQDGLSFFTTDAKTALRNSESALDVQSYHLSIKNPLRPEEISMENPEKWVVDWAETHVNKGVFKDVSEAIKSAKEGMIPMKSMEAWRDFLKKGLDADYDGYIGKDPTEGKDVEIFVTNDKAKSRSSTFSVSLAGSRTSPSTFCTASGCSALGTSAASCF